MSSGDSLDGISVERSARLQPCLWRAFRSTSRPLASRTEALHYARPLASKSEALHYARRARGLGLALAGALLFAACGSKPVDPDAQYTQALLAARAAKDDSFRNQPNQPIPPARMSELLPLRYFAPDPEYAVPASLKPSGARTRVRMPTSTGKMRDMEVVGLLEFTLKGRKLALGAFVEAGQAGDRLFVPFSDLTTGTETYAAGRYIEIDRAPTGVYVVDFNRAFHPFCYYNADYDCPYPPPQSRLPLPIRAGEKLAESVELARPRR